MSVFSIDQETQTLTVVEEDELPRNPIFPRQFRLTHDLTLAPYGVIPAGAVADAALEFDGVLTLKFVKWWKALRQWDNILLLFPECVDIGLFNALQAVPEASARSLLSSASSLASLVT